MKYFILAILCLAVVSANESIVFKKFMEFTRKYNKVYGSMEEFKKRYQNFQDSLIEVVENDDFSGDHTIGITKFSDLTKAEFRAKYLTLKMQENSWCQKEINIVAKAPESLDWRSKGGVSPIKNQGDCGSCWAFSTIGFLESQSLIVNKKSEIYSEQQLVDCDHNGDEGCNGGLMQTALKYIQQKGIETEKNYPYHAKDQKCKYKKADVVHTVSDVKCFEKISNADLQSMVATVGPLAIAVDADSFMSYSSGVLKCKGKQLNHGVLLVGYTPTTWIIKNSWGKDWGEKGFVRVHNTNRNNCGVGLYVATATLK